jgi:cytoskeletal protein RodZ
MQAQLAKADFSEKNQLQTAVTAIEARVQSGAEETTVPAPAAGQTEATPPAASETATAEAKPRTWHDATGTYQVEATFVRFANGKVTLKPTNGKEMTIPLGKLSTEDREYVEKQPKPANPFE